MSGVSSMRTCDSCEKAYAAMDCFAGKTMNGSTPHKSCFTVKIKVLQRDVDGLTETVDALKTIIRIQNGEPVDQRDSKGNTALMVVAKLGLRDEVAMLISKGANVNEHDDRGDSPLFIATTYRHSEVALVLIQAGANPYERDTFSSLFLATQKRMYDVIEASIQANPKVPDFFKEYLLQAAKVDDMLRPILLKFKLIGAL